MCLISVYDFNKLFLKITVNQIPLNMIANGYIWDGCRQLKVHQAFPSQMSRNSNHASDFWPNYASAKAEMEKCDLVSKMNIGNLCHEIYKSELSEPNPCLKECHTRFFKKTICPVQQMRDWSTKVWNWQCVLDWRYRNFRRKSIVLYRLKYAWL